MGVSSQRYALAALSLWEEPRSQWIGSFDGSRAYMDNGEVYIYGSSILDPVITKGFVVSAARWSLYPFWKSPRYQQIRSFDGSMAYMDTGGG
jgi:hypothetical protein